MDTTSTLLHLTVDHFDEIMRLHRVKRWVYTGKTRDQLPEQFVNHPSPSVEHVQEESKHIAHTAPGCPRKNPLQGQWNILKVLFPCLETCFLASINSVTNGSGPSTVAGVEGGGSRYNTPVEVDGDDTIPAAGEVAASDAIDLRHNNAVAADSVHSGGNAQRAETPRQDRTPHVRGY